MNISTKTLLATTVFAALFSSQTVLAGESGLQDEYTPYTVSTPTTNDSDRVNYSFETPTVNASVEADFFPVTNR